MPLSGPNAGLGQAILNAAQLALFETGGDQLTLVPRDTKGTPARCRRRRACGGRRGVSLILGPLLAAEVEAVKPIAHDAHINVIAFSTVTDLAGGNTFLMGFLPRQEVVREVAYARQRGIARFAALAPDTAYGHLMADALRDTASSTGGDASPRSSSTIRAPAMPQPRSRACCRRAPAPPRRAAPPDAAAAPDQTAPARAGGAGFRCAAAAGGRRPAEADRRRR